MAWDDVFECGVLDQGAGPAAPAGRAGLSPGARLLVGYGLLLAVLVALTALGASQTQGNDRNLYLMVIDANEAVLLAHGNNVRNVGMDAHSRDVDGKLFLQEMARTARQGGDWSNHKWARPVTNEILADLLGATGGRRGGGLRDLQAASGVGPCYLRITRMTGGPYKNCYWSGTSNK